MLGKARGGWTSQVTVTRVGALGGTAAQVSAHVRAKHEAVKREIGRRAGTRIRRHRAALVVVYQAQP